MSSLETYVASWRQSADNIQDLCAGLSTEEWALPTDCPGWTVQDVVAHLAHLECVLATGDDAGLGEQSHAVASSYTEHGVDARRGRDPQELLDELQTSVEKRAKTLRALPDDPSATADITPGGIKWSWDTLLSNRALDMWVHEQDIRRAIGKPGGMDVPGAQITTMTLGAGMPYVLGKKVKPAAGTTVVWRVTGEAPFEIAAVIGEDGRASKLDASPQDATTTLTMSTEAFTIIAAGRRGPDGLGIVIDGDRALGDAVLAAMGVTP